MPRSFSEVKSPEYTYFDASDYYQTEIIAAGTAHERQIQYSYHPVTGDKLSIIAVLRG
ncbi:MAG: hypothetical protein L3J69_18200 [Desulfobacula sp.]|nr:hypothetical protein [Desulfobacula sp.]